MKYTVYPQVFELNPNIEFGIIIGRDLTVSQSTESDQRILLSAQGAARQKIDPAIIRELPNIAAARQVLQQAGINPNKYTPSVEAMLKRVVKGSNLASINSLVDLCNAVSLENEISLGAHDLKDIDADLEVRLSRSGDRFLPFGETIWENVEDGELIFTAGPTVQTRKWIWRQSELGKITEDTHNVFFQVAGFRDNESLKNAVQQIEQLVRDRFGGTTTTFFVNQDQSSIEF
ncbi:MAG: phenylalanine--tRNA ligase beta subunit-related protein [Clostridiaceae bacterium]